MIGKTISHYRIIEELGRGGMGVVYKAEDLTLQRTVALKFLAPHVVTDEEHKKRMLHEARATAALDHPNISTIYGIEESEGHTFIVMAFIEGESLSDRIETGQMEILDALDIAIQTARGLSRAHAAGIIHRDIKPGNILVNAESQVKIVDFGLAKLASQTRLTQAGTILGTMAYMSPEQVTGADTDASSDIWALAVLLYEMLAGQAPFRGEMDAAVMYSIMNEDPEPLTEVRKDATVELERILEKALSKDPEKRIQSVDEFLSGLEEIRDRQTLGMKQGRFATFKRTKVRKRIAAAAVVAAIVISAVFLMQFLGSGPSKIESVAVLPFMNLSGDSDQEYFSDGMTEALISQLGQVRALKVTSRTSVMQFKGTTKTLPQIGKELDVDAIVEASVMRSGERLKIVIKLYRADSEQQLWTDEYDRKIEDVLSIYSEVAQAITGEIDIALTSDESESMIHTRAIDPEAYDAYLRGRHHLNSWDHMKALGYFMDAIKIEPTYAEAYAGLASTYNGLGLFGILTADEAYPKAKAAAEKALKLDDSQGAAYSARAFARLVYDRDWQGSEADYKKALELSPNSPEVYMAYDMYLTLVGRYEEAVEYCKRMIELDPLTLENTLHLAWIYNYAGMYDEAIESTNEVLKIAPSLYAYSTLADSYFKKGMHTEAVAFYDSAFSLSTGSGNGVLLAGGGYVYARSGREDRAKEILDQILSLSESGNVSPVYVAQVYSGLRQTDEMFEWLEKSYETGGGISIALDFGEYRDDPRYIDLCRRIGIPLD